MRKIILPLLLLLLLQPFMAHSQTPAIHWEKTWSASQAVFGLQSQFDAQGNALLAGTFRTTVDLDPGTGIASYTAVGTFNGYLLKLDVNGNYMWSIAYLSESKIYEIHVDANNDIVVCGGFQHTVDFDPSENVFELTSNGLNDCFIAKYTAEGTFLWAISMGSDLNDDPFSLDTDAAGNICVAGSFFHSMDLDGGAGTAVLTATGNSDAGFVAKYDSNGNYQWAQLMSSTGSARSRTIRIQPDGDVYVAGDFITDIQFDASTMITATSASIFFAQYSAAGNLLWARSISSPINFNINAGDLDAGGNLYITGLYSGNSDFDPSAEIFELADPTNAGNAFVAKYDGDGNLVWAHSIGGETTSEYAWDVNVSSTGNVYVAGTFDGVCDFDFGPEAYELTGNFGDGYVLGFDANEDFLWAWSFGANQYDIANSVATHSSGAVLCSSSRRPAGDSPHAYAGLTRFESIPQSVENNAFVASISLFPNPSNDRITIQSPNTISGIRLINLQGQTVKSIPGFARQISLDVSHLSSGIYFAEVQSNHQLERIKFVVN